MALDAELAVREYLRRMAQIRSTGGATSETSFYSALESLLNAVGSSLSPRVVCNGQLRDQGGGHPDFGLYSIKQCKKGELKKGQGEVPERGVVEVKPLAQDTWQTCQGPQATKYFDRYRLVLVTNYRDFRLIGDDDGTPAERDFFSFAASEAEFWLTAASPAKVQKERCTRFVEFLKRALLNAAPLHKPEDVAWFLASYARDTLEIIESKDASALSSLKTALENSLGISFEGKKGTHLFKSTLVQTLYYGIFSAWVTLAREKPADQFDWRHAGYILTVPMISALFEEISRPSHLGPLGVISTLDRTNEALGRINRDAFFKLFDAEQAVQHFYEPFLEAFDPSLRKQMGVWYTPPEVVRYMVERVDTLLRTELGIENGLADESVFVLDPCCGTGAFVVEVLRRIEKTLRETTDDALVGDDLKQVALNRVFGFEILSAPFVIAHWQIGTLLTLAGAPLNPEKGERPAIYLTNALTGWEPAVGKKAVTPAFKELQDERDKASHVKQGVPLLVILGNPPYNAFAGKPPKNDALVAPYKEGLRDKWDVKKYNLDELYVRFLRIAERRISELGRGIISYISNNSFLTEPSFVVMRQQFLGGFDNVWIENLNGDSRATGKLTPEGEPDPSIFSTPLNRAGIRVGTAISTYVRSGVPDQEVVVRYRDFWGTTKRQELEASLSDGDLQARYRVAEPAKWNKLSLKPVAVQPEYLEWPEVAQISREVFNGPIERRGMALIRMGSETQVLRNLMKKYLDASVTNAGVAAIDARLMKSSGEFKGAKTRADLIVTSTFSADSVVSYPFKPFDIRVSYLANDIAPLFSRPAPELLACRSAHNWFFLSRDQADKTPEGVPFFASDLPVDYDFMSGHARHFPVFVETKVSATASEKQQSLTLETGGRRANLSPKAATYLRQLGIIQFHTDPTEAELIWLHCLAVGFSPAYLGRHREAINIGWPRIPLPAKSNMLRDSAVLGRRVRSLLGSGSSQPFEELKMLGSFGRIMGTDLAVTAGWGRKDTLGKVFPGPGSTLARSWYEEEVEALNAVFAIHHLTAERAFTLLGPAVDVFLNGENLWSGVPTAVWTMHIGGYQVLKKWLSYREFGLIGRALLKEEAREFSAIVRRLMVLALMTDELDSNYDDVAADYYPWT